MKAITAVGLAVNLAWAAHALAEPANNPAFQAQMKKIEKEVHQDFNGPKGQEARRVCSRILGITSEPVTMKDIIRAGYSAELAMKWADCTVNYAYPMPAPKVR